MERSQAIRGHSMQKVYGNGKSNKEVAMRGQEIQSEENGKTKQICREQLPHIPWHKNYLLLLLRVLFPKGRSKW